MTPAKKVRSARQYLRRTAKAGTKDIPPKKFAAAAHESGSSFNDIMGVIRYYYADGDERAEMRRTQLAKASRGRKDGALIPGP